MISLIAEAKTMRDAESAVSREEFEKHCPVGESVADEVMARVAGMTVAEIVAAVKVSATMAARLLRMAYEFPNKALGLKAIEAYTGVVFKALDFNTLNDSERTFAFENVGILSSLYGWLRPDDIIKPYRLEYSTRLAPGDRALAEYWRKDVTISLVRHIREHGDSDVLDLLPGDAAKSVDRKLVKRFAKVWKVDFMELQPGGEYRTPNSSRLKTLRGTLLREIISRGITSPSELLTLHTDTLLPLGTPDYPDHIAFCV